ncbi:MAG: hypothetical protein HRT94_03865 [Alphaproteobacteria bacterium]|nr:hypothetical protein [Alphaproteobacteria bacterium]
MDFDPKQITQDDGHIHIFSDASFVPNGKRLGIAWVIATDTPETPIIVSKTIPAEDFSECMATFYGESTAVAEGLELLPANSKVKTHTDHRWLYEKMNGLDITPASGPGKIPSPGRARTECLERIDEASKLHEDVSIEYAHDSPKKEPSGLKRYYMAPAHNAANDAAGARSHIDVPSPYEPDTVLKAAPIPAELRHDASGAMDVIDFDDDDSTDENHDSEGFDPRFQKPPRNNGPNF